MGEREVGVQRDRVLEHLQRELEVLPRVAPRVAAAAQVEVVGLEVLGRLGRERLLLLRRERDPQRLGDLARDLVLHREHVGHLAVVALGPQQRVRFGVHELGRDAQPVAAAADAAGEHGGGLELLADLRRRDRLVAERQHRLAREDLSPLILRAP